MLNNYSMKIMHCVLRHSESIGAKYRHFLGGDIMIPFGGCDRAIEVGNLQCRYVLMIWIIVGKRPTMLVVGTVGLFNIFLSPVISFFFIPLSGRRLDID